MSIKQLTCALVLLLFCVCPVLAQEDGGDFGMTGCVVPSQGDCRSVLQVLEHSPADEAGIKAGDAILAIDNKGTSGLEPDEFLKRMRGKPGTEVILTVRSNETGVVFNYKLKRMSVAEYRRVY